MIKVVAAVIEKDGEFLVCRRGAGGNCAFLWEFPGGKIEEDETPNDALIREIREELDIEIEPLSLFDEFSFSYPDKDIFFTLSGQESFQEKSSSASIPNRCG